MIREQLATGRTHESTGFRWRGTDVSRLEQFSDAVFAFALALLVVSTNIPTTTRELFEILQDFPAFGLTFAVLVWIWYEHYIYFRRYGLVDALSTFLNAVLLFLILFYVYPLKFLFGALIDEFTTGDSAITYADGGALMVTYSLGFVAVFGMFALLYRHALAKAAALELSDREVLITRASIQSNLMLVAIGLVSVLLAWLGPPWLVPVAGMLYWLIGPAMWWHWSRSFKKWEALP